VLLLGISAFLLFALYSFCPYHVQIVLAIN
jgi:hypothetical protein